MFTVTRILGFVCMWAACDKEFPYPQTLGNLPKDGRPPVIRTSNGRISGYYMSSLSSQAIGAYEGIPYAENPTGQLRFRDPLPKRPWNNGVLRANRRVSCIQMDPTRYYRVIGQEDCLVVNVYIPLNRAVATHNFPVMVWIHGGSWHWGSGSQYGPAYLLDYDVVLVTLNYRLGPLGFLSAEKYSGNFGLKDQSMAIRWVRRHIRNFGGNPDQITLIGQSAGGASAHLHMMSPLSQGNFQRVVSLSGSALAFWAVPPNQTVLANRLASFLGCYPGSNHRSVVDCLRDLPARRIVAKQYDLFELLENPSILFGPTVERNTHGAFLVDTPIQLYKTGRVANIPWITGILKDEGDLFTLVNYAAPFAVRRLVRDLDETIPIILSYSSNSTKATHAIKKFYFGNTPSFSFSGFESLHSISSMIGDRYFYVPFHSTLKIHSSTVTAPLYAYHFTFHGKHSLAEKLGFPAQEWGVMHQDELQYIFNASELWNPLEKTGEDYVVSKYFTDLIVNFAATGTPTVDHTYYYFRHNTWVPYSAQSPGLLEINLNPGMTREPNSHRITFWHSIKCLFGV